MNTIGIINQNFNTFNNEEDYDYVLTTTDIDEAIAFLSDKDISEYTVEEYEADEDGEFISGSDFDPADNFLKRNDALKYWLETDANYGFYSTGKEDRRWALHRVIGESDEIVAKNTYLATPGFEDEEDATEANWQALDKEIENQIGFVPEYEVN